MRFQVRITDSNWLDLLSSIEDLRFANFWTGSPNPRIGERIIFLRGGSVPRKVAGWGTVLRSGIMTSQSDFWDAENWQGEKITSPRSQVHEKKCFMILKDVVLLGEFEPFETDVFIDEYDAFPKSGAGWKNYENLFPEILEDLSALGNLEEGHEIKVVEGGQRFVTHLKRERKASRHFREQMIQRAKKKTGGKVPCSACGLDTLGLYGFDDPIVDCHHLAPLGELSGGATITAIDDLILLCPSCHRAIHKQKDVSDIKELRRRLGTGI